MRHVKNLTCIEVPGNFFHILSRYFFFIKIHKKGLGERKHSFFPLFPFLFIDSSLPLPLFLPFSVHLSIPLPVPLAYARVDLNETYFVSFFHGTYQIFKSRAQFWGRKIIKDHEQYTPLSNSIPKVIKPPLPRPQGGATTNSHPCRREKSLS